MTQYQNHQISPIQKGLISVPTEIQQQNSFSIKQKQKQTQDISHASTELADFISHAAILNNLWTLLALTDFKLQK